VGDLGALVDLVNRETGELYVRWSHGRQVNGDGMSSRDGLTGVSLPGLSANPLRVEPWWGGRSLRLWLARRLYDYRHLKDLRGAVLGVGGAGSRPWTGQRAAGGRRAGRWRGSTTSFSSSARRRSPASTPPSGVRWTAAPEGHAAGEHDEHVLGSHPDRHVDLCHVAGIPGRWWPNR
jgi:Family of unknown function (DUF6098)